MFKAVTRQFNIENLLEEQQKSLCEFLGGHNIFVNLLNSLIFQFCPSQLLLCLQDHEAQVLWFGGCHGVLKIPSLICATTNVLKFQ